MAIYIVGYEISKGEFQDKTGNTITYNNRLLNCATDDVRNVVGFSCYQVKLKANDIANCLGVSSDDDSVNSALSNLLKKEIEFFTAPKHGTLTVVGFKPVLKK